MASGECLRVDGDDHSPATLRQIKAVDAHAENCHETSVTLCFVRGTGRIALNGQRVEYGGKWFEIPRGMQYSVFPETDTVVLTLQKPIRYDFDTKEDPSGSKHP